MRKLAVLVALVLLAATLPAGAGSVSWQTEPILGYSYVSNGDVLIQTDNGWVTIPHYSISGDPLEGVGGPGVSTFWINPIVWDGSAHFYDPAVWVYSGSGVIAFRKSNVTAMPML